MSATALSRYVARNPEILSKEPIIKNTRTSVRAICWLVAFGHNARRNFTSSTSSHFGTGV